MLTRLSPALLCITFQANAQVNPNAFGYYQDALRFSVQPIWSARYFGLEVLLYFRADISSTILGPAGLGFYNRNQVVFTPSFTFNNYTTTITVRSQKVMKI